jgi:hypothetical protein
MSRVITYVLGYNNTGMIHNNKDLGWNRTAYDVTLQTQGGGNISASPADYGFPGQTITLSNTASPDYQFNSYQTTGATLTGNQFTIGNEDVTAKAVFDRIYKVTTKTNGHGQLVASPTSGINGTTVGLTATPSSHYSFNQYSITGATLTGNNFNINGSDITVSANFVEDPKYTVTLSTSGQGKITANKTTGYAGDIVTLSNTASANYGFVNYSITGATLTGNQFAIGNTNITARANFSAIPQYTAKNTDGGYLMSTNASAWFDSDVRTVYIREKKVALSYNLPYKTTAAGYDYYLMPTPDWYQTFMDNSAWFAGYKVTYMTDYPGFDRYSGRYLNASGIVSSIGFAATPYIYLNPTATTRSVTIYAAVNNGPRKTLDTFTNVEPGHTYYSVTPYVSFTFSPKLIVKSGTKVNIKLYCTDTAVSASITNCMATWAGTMSGLKE